MIIRNPQPTNAATWVAEEIPITKTNGPVAMRLKKFEPGAYPEVEIVGEDSSHWRLENQDFKDPVGNSGMVLCREEPAWKFCATAFRTEHAPFASNELWRLPSRLVPGPGVLNALQLSNTIASVPVTILYFGGPGKYVFSNNVCISKVPWKPGMGGELSTSAG